jgi:UDPglucose 6-dehydrogenase
MSKTLGVPQPDDDVVNKEPRVLLIGFGWVGQYCGKYFKNADIVTTDGVQKKEYEHYDLAIISVPTPMNPETGRCDTSIVEDVVVKYKDIVDYFLIKSTVEIGTTDHLKEKHLVRIAMSPEYVGETLGHPLLEPRRDAFQIIGGEDETASAIAGFWRTVLNANAPILICKAVEAEIIKYCENYWITARVDYWNDVYEICQTLGGEFDRVREGLVLDPRMSRTHSNVYPNNRGWSGKCLSKDMPALVCTMRMRGNPLTTLEHIINKNATKWRGNYKNKERLMPDKPLWKENE